MTPNQKETLVRVTKKLLEMPTEEFHKLLEKHKDGDIARTLRYAWNPESEEFKTKDEKIQILVDALIKCKCVIKYAHENHANQYYLNTLDMIDRLLKEFQGENK